MAWLNIAETELQPVSDFAIIQITYQAVHQHASNLEDCAWSAFMVLTDRRRFMMRSTRNFTEYLVVDKRTQCALIIPMKGCSRIRFSIAGPSGTPLSASARATSPAALAKETELEVLDML